MLVSSEKYGFDPGSGKYFSLISDPGVKKAPDPGSGSAALNQCLRIDIGNYPSSGSALI
jgi:hypothetical protein